MIELNEEQQITINTVKQIVQDKIKPRAAEIDEKGEFPYDILEIYSQNGLLSPLIPEEYGGINSGFLLLALIVEEIAKACASSALMLISQADGLQPILCGGSDDIKKRYLPGFVNGNHGPVRISCRCEPTQSEGAMITSSTVRRSSSLMPLWQMYFLSLPIQILKKGQRDSLFSLLKKVQKDLFLARMKGRWA